MPEFKSPTDKTRKVKLESAIEQVLWKNTAGAPNGKIGLEVFTKFIGNNSDIQIEISDGSGKKFETIKKKTFGNRFIMEITIPENAKDELFAEVKLPKHNLSKKSNSLYLFPLIQITNLKWDKNEARRGDELKLSANIQGVADGTQVEIQIFEHDTDGAHDPVTKFPATIKNSKIEAEWEYEYYEDTENIPSHDETEKGYHAPAYFFRISFAGVSTNSGLLEFRDWVEIQVLDEKMNPISGIEYSISLADGTKKNVKFDEDGKLHIDSIPPGKIKINDLQ